jgi:hypothetical protein
MITVKHCVVLHCHHREEQLPHGVGRIPHVCRSSGQAVAETIATGPPEAVLLPIHNLDLGMRRLQVTRFGSLLTSLAACNTKPSAVDSTACVNPKTRGSRRG